MARLHQPFPDLMQELPRGEQRAVQLLRPWTARCISASAHALHSLLKHRIKIFALEAVHEQVLPIDSALQSFPAQLHVMRTLCVATPIYQRDSLHAALALIVYLMSAQAWACTGGVSAMPSSCYVEALVHLSGWLHGGIIEKKRWRVLGRSPPHGLLLTRLDTPCVHSRTHQLRLLRGAFASPVEPR